jgi:hypothetical protein
MVGGGVEICESDADGVGVGVCDLLMRVLLETWAEGGGVKLMLVLSVASWTRSAWTLETTSLVPCGMLKCAG